MHSTLANPADLNLSLSVDNLKKSKNFHLLDEACTLCDADSGDDDSDVGLCIFVMSIEVNWRYRAISSITNNKNLTKKNKKFQQKFTELGPQLNPILTIS